MWLWALIPNKVKSFLAAAGVILAGVLFAYSKGRRAGKDAVAIDNQKQTQKINDRFQKIDSQPIDFNAAVERLRDRSKPK